jgi:hypothetical protein
MKNVAIVGAICITLLVGIWLFAAKGDGIQKLPIELKSESGRFVMYQLGAARADQYLIDSVTGRAWRVVTISDNKEYDSQLWPVPYHTGQGMITFKAPSSRRENTVEVDRDAEAWSPPASDKLK